MPRTVVHQLVEMLDGFHNDMSHCLSYMLSLVSFDQMILCRHENRSIKQTVLNKSHQINGRGRHHNQANCDDSEISSMMALISAVIVL